MVHSSDEKWVVSRVYAKEYFKNYTTLTVFIYKYYSFPSPHECISIFVFTSKNMYTLHGIRDIEVNLNMWVLSRGCKYLGPWRQTWLRVSGDNNNEKMATTRIRLFTRTDNANGSLADFIINFTEVHWAYAQQLRAVPFNRTVNAPSLHYYLMTLRLRWTDNENWITFAQEPYAKDTILQMRFNCPFECFENM